MSFGFNLEPREHILNSTWKLWGCRWIQLGSSVAQILNNKSGTIKLGNLSPTRDFTYVEDTVNSFINAIKYKKNIHGEIVNIGNNFEISIGNILKIFKKDFNLDFNGIKGGYRSQYQKNVIFVY